VRRVLAFLLAALLVAAGFGIHSRSQAIAVNGTSVSAPEITAELATLSHTPTVQCFFGALAQNGFSSAAGADSVSPTAVAAWLKLRVEGLAIASYVKSAYHYVPSSAALATATSALEGELTQAAVQNSLNCPGSSTSALAALPAPLRRAEVAEQADSMFLLTKLKTTIPLTASSIASYYRAHRSSYRTYCISVALVPITKAKAFQNAVHAGQTTAQVARRFSIDPSGKKGGAYGCYSPSNSVYPQVSSDVKGLKKNQWSTPFAYNNSADVLYVVPTSMTTAPLRDVAASIVAAIQSQNAKSASAVEASLLYYAQVSIDDSLGLWTLTSAGPTVGALTTPATANVTSPTLFTATTAPKYQ